MFEMLRELGGQVLSPPSPAHPTVINQQYNLGGSYTSGYARLIVLGRTNQGYDWVSGMPFITVAECPEYWLDLSVALKAGSDWWFSGVNISILRPLTHVNPMDWQVVHAGIQVGNVPVSLPRPAYFPNGLAVAVLYHEAAAYGGSVGNSILVAGSYYAV